MTKALMAALLAVILWALIEGKGEAKPKPAKPHAHSTRFVAEHTNAILRKKCRPTHSSLAGSRASWLFRHRAAHRAKRMRCEPKLVVRYVSAWLCIHRYEGSWTDTGDPYWGGLQMDRSFMTSYAPSWLLRKGWAHTWTPREQMWVAERAHRTRGFYPWPNTARMCGLL